jgi:hypothetical protein
MRPRVPLQHTAGDRADRRSPEPGTESNDLERATGTAPVFSGRHGHDFSGVPVHAVTRGNLQAKLKVNAPRDAYEAEANRAAEQVLNMPEPLPLHQDEAQSIPGRPLVQRRVSKQGDAMDAPPIVNDVISSTGQPLNDETRRFFEPRFQHDFSRVRIHSGARAAESAGEVGALAYTVGRHVVFNRGEYAPATNPGKRLLAHELAHVVQQTATGHAGAPAVQRWESCASECPGRDPGEEDRARDDPMLVGELPDLPGLLVANFDIGSGKTKPDLATNTIFKDYWKQMAKAAPLEWEIWGFSDCTGGEKVNESLRLMRARAVNASLPPAAKARVTTVSGADLGDCVAGNESELGRTYNRSAVLKQKDVPPQIEFEDLEVEGDKPPEKEEKPKQKMLPGNLFRVDAPASPGWASVDPTYVFTIRGEPREFPHYLKVRVDDATGSKWNVIAQEGRYNGSDADIDPAKLNGTAAYASAGKIKFDKAGEQLWYGGNGPVEAFTQDTNPVPDGTHDLEIPDFQHSLGSKYGDYATTWFRIGHSGDRYLHPGSVSLGCSTVRETGKWPDIWRYLIRRRKDDNKSVGTIEVV